MGLRKEKKIGNVKKQHKARKIQYQGNIIWWELQVIPAAIEKGIRVWGTA